MILLGAICISVQGNCAVSARIELDTSWVVVGFWGFFFLHCSGVQINAIAEVCQRIYSKIISEYQDYKTCSDHITLEQPGKL